MIMKDINETVHIVPYDDQWPELFEREKYRLKKALNKYNFDVEHIGSTSVSGLSSKPIVDIMIGVESYPPSTKFILQICDLGYIFHGEANVPERLYFTRRGQHNFNLAVVLLSGNHWTTNLNFRNFLRNHPQECRKYEKIKRDAISSGATKLLSYSDFKQEFITGILSKL